MPEVCFCEEFAHGELGQVQDHEPLIRILHDKYIGRGGQLRPGAFSKTDLQDRGLSLIRMDHVTADKLQEIAVEIVQAANAQEVKGALVANASVLRDVREPSGDRTLCVKDDPVLNDKKLSDNPADAITMSTIRKSDEDILALRDALLSQFIRVKLLSDLK